MPRQSERTPGHRRVPQQIELFAEGAPTTIGSMPAWSGLPTETRAALTKLMMRLILDHADKIRIGSIAGGGDDL